MGRIETRKRILDSATGLFADYGYDGVRTKQIAEKASVSEVTLFKYFASKDDLYQTILKSASVYPDMTGAMKDVTYGDLKSDLMILAMAIVEHSINMGSLMVIMEKENKLHPVKRPTIEEDPVYPFMKKLFIAYSEQGILNASVEDVAPLFRDLLRGVFVIARHDNKSQDELVSYIEAFIYNFCRGCINK